MGKGRPTNVWLSFSPFSGPFEGDPKRGPAVVGFTRRERHLKRKGGGMSSHRGRRTVSDGVVDDAGERGAAWRTVGRVVRASRRSRRRRALFESGNGCIFVALGGTIVGTMIFHRDVPCGRNSVVESQPSKLLVEGSNPFARF